MEPSVQILYWPQENPQSVHQSLSSSATLSRTKHGEFSGLVYQNIHSHLMLLCLSLNLFLKTSQPLDVETKAFTSTVQDIKRSVISILMKPDLKQMDDLS